MSIKDKLNKRLEGKEEVQETGMKVHKMNSVKITLGEVCELCKECTCKEAKAYLENVIKKNGGPKNVGQVLVMDQADLARLTKGGDVVEELDEDGLCCKVHLSATPSAPAKDPKK